MLKRLNKVSHCCQCGHSAQHDNFSANTRHDVTQPPVMYYRVLGDFCVIFVPVLSILDSEENLETFLVILDWECTQSLTTRWRSLSTRRGSARSWFLWRLSGMSVGCVESLSCWTVITLLCILRKEVGILCRLLCIYYCAWQFLSKSTLTKTLCSCQKISTSIQMSNVATSPPNTCTQCYDILDTEFIIAMKTTSMLL